MQKCLDIGQIILYNILDKIMSYDRTNGKLFCGKLRKIEMYENVGGKIKGVATAVTVIGIIVSAIGFIALCIAELVVVGLIVLIVGCLVSWLSSLTLYGFGQLIENSDIIAGKQKANKNSYINDRYFRVTETDERTFEQVVESSNLSNEQKRQIMELRKWLDDDRMDVSDCCKKIRQIASDQPEEIVTKIIARL